MTPKEKAIELIDKFKYISYDLDDIDNHKECAIICVDEIIKAIDFDWMEIQNLEMQHRYYQEVKNEIEKL